MWISHAKQATEKHKTIEIKHKKQIETPGTANIETQEINQDRPKLHTIFVFYRTLLICREHIY
jgi:hypothetical protein